MDERDNFLSIADAAEVAQHIFEKGVDTARLGAAFGWEFENPSGITFFLKEHEINLKGMRLSRALKLLALGGEREMRWGGV